ncbi:MAG: SpoIIE family protein phosphatase [Planctomycetota bacterium]|nr:SpoIIE family protein phosphatase [Planctomycetota bacterium]
MSTKSTSEEKQIRELNALIELSGAMAHELELDALLLTIVRKTTEIMQADRSSLFLYDSKTNELWSKIAQGMGTMEIRFPVGIGIAGDVARTGEGSNIADAYNDKRFNQAFDKASGYRTKSVLCLPIKDNEGELVGVIQVLNKLDGDRFDEHDEQMLAALGSHAVVALQRARLVEAYVEKERMEEALKVAQNIQMGLLPNESPVVKGYDIAGFSVACDETGGDYFDYIVLDDGRIGLVIGDVSGHGLGAAMFMATARASLRSLMMTSDDLPQILYRLNNRLNWDMSDEAFMTFFMAILDPNNGTLRYSSAGHEEGIIYRASDGSFDMLESTGLPLGMMEDMDYPEGPMTIMNEGDILLLTTDGVFEAMDVDDEQLGHPRMLDRLKDYSEASSMEITTQIKDLTFEWIGELGTCRDDVTIVTAKCLRKAVEKMEDIDLFTDGEEFAIAEVNLNEFAEVGDSESDEMLEVSNFEQTDDLEEIEDLDQMELME